MKTHEEGFYIFKPIKIADIELSCPSNIIDGLDGYAVMQVLVRLHGAPIGYVKIPVNGNHCNEMDIRKAILERHSHAIIRHLLCDRLATTPNSSHICIEDLFSVQHPAYSESQPLVTVAVCTRNRPSHLALCLESIDRLDYPNMDILVVDNAPDSDSAERLVRERHPNMRYICEPRPGLNWARNRAIMEALGDIVAYADDDVTVDSGWVKALANVFTESPEVMAVTGLVTPHELETEAQVLFEWRGGFGRGFNRRWCGASLEDCEQTAALYGGTGQFGTGANMAYRKSLFDQIGYFDPALDVGTPTEGGGDLEMFFRVLKAGHMLVYEPSAIVRHRHRRDYEQLQAQLTGWGTGTVAFFVRSCVAYPDERSAFIRFWLRFIFREQIMRRMLLSFVHPSRMVKSLIRSEVRGHFIGLVRYHRALSHVKKIIETFGPVEALQTRPVSGKDIVNGRKAIAKHPRAVAVRNINLCQPLPTLTDVTDYSDVCLFLVRKDVILGSVNIANNHQPISKTRLCEAIVDQLGLKLLEHDKAMSQDMLQAKIYAALIKHYVTTDNETKNALSKLPADVPVSIIVATKDRPEDLLNCLSSLIGQRSPRKVEIIVVDNNPASGLTPPVVAGFPGVLLLNESNRGLSYARNTGIIASRGDIVITTDDDVTMPPDWIEKLLAPFIRPDVMIVTGNVLPLELETPAQQLFEVYGGLGRGFEQLEANLEWFESFLRRAVPTWKLGGTANAAFRASIFSRPQIGLMEEALGAGTPSGCSEDTYIFYRALKTGCKIVYEPSAYVWHKHRRDMSALRRQIYNYSKGHVAYHLTTLISDHDLRALIRLVFELPLTHIRRIKERLFHKSAYPVSLIILEILGNGAGPWAFWRSRRRAKRKGRSKKYIPAYERRNVTQEFLSK